MKFRLTEEKKIKNMADVVNTLLNNFEKMTENEILDLTQEGITSTIESNAPMFISPNGSIIDVKKLTGLATPMHLDFIYDLLYYKLNEIDNELSMDDITEVDESIEAEELEYLSDKGWIRLNPGTASVEKRFYCVLPFKDAIKPTERQYDILKDFIEYGQEKNKKQLLIYYGDSAKWYNLQDEEAEDIINEIKRYYAGFNENKKNKMKFKLVEELSNEYDSEGNQLTKEQAEFFKNSKIRDSQGRLLVCYHGTDAEFDEFNPSEGGLLGGGIYFSYGDSQYNRGFKRFLKCYLNISNPLMIDNESFTQYKLHKGFDTMQQMVVSRGYDGIISDWREWVIAYHPNQIKSITNKNPTNSNNINESNLNEVYPNKGESKKDFIARFMSVTKDEYPDIKQRYAVANSYWSRKDKQK